MNEWMNEWMWIKSQIILLGIQVFMDKNYHSQRNFNFYIIYGLLSIYLPNMISGGRRVNEVIVTTITTPITLALFSVPNAKKTSNKNKTKPWKRDGFSIMETDKELYRCELTAHLLPVNFCFPTIH